MEDYLDDLTWAPSRSGLPIQVATRNVRLNTVKGFCHWLYECNHISADVALKVIRAREPSLLPKDVPGEEALRKLLDLIGDERPIGLRDRAILEVLYSTGIRVGELVMLDVVDVDLEGGYVHVRYGKGGKGRVVPIGAHAGETVARYAKSARPQIARDDEQALFVNRQTGARLGVKGVEVLVRGYARRAGVPHLTPHGLRRACATHMLRRGASLRHLQEMLGHAQVTTTERYTRLTSQELIEAHRKYHPREQERFLNRLSGATLPMMLGVDCSGALSQNENSAFTGGHRDVIRQY